MIHIVFQFKLEPSSRSKMKRPYDSDMHEVLKAAFMRTSKLFYDVHGIITHDAIIAVTNDHLTTAYYASHITAYANDYIKKGPLLIFNVKPYLGAMPGSVRTTDEVIEKMQDRIATSAYEEYEMYLEEYAKQWAGGLFPDEKPIPFSSTPEFFRRGIVLKR